MNNIQLPFLVEGVLVLGAMVFGFLLERVGCKIGSLRCENGRSRKDRPPRAAIPLPGGPCYFVGLG